MKYLHDAGLVLSPAAVLEVAEAFADELERGLSGKSSSLAMNPSCLPWKPGRSGRSVGRVIVLDAGGTRFRAARVSWESGAREVEKQVEVPMPGTQGLVSKQAFFDAMAAALGEVMEEALPIGFCFSFPTDIQADKDGRLVQFSKEIQAPEVVGQLVGHELKLALARKASPRPGALVVLNDTVATLLAAEAVVGSDHWSSGIGLILGTGTNGCYPEPSRQGEVYNTEWGAFRLFPRGSLDQAFANLTQDPDAYWLEKTISGAYLGPLCSLAVEQALGQSEKWTTADLADPLGRAEGDKVRIVVEAVVDRGAALLAAATAAVLWRTGGGHQSDRPVGIIAEGSTFWKLPGLKGRFETHLKGLLQGSHQRHYSLQQIPQAPFWGSAAASRW